MSNYYLFEPLVDEKGEPVVRRPKAYEYFVYNEFVGTSYGLGNTEYPIMVMKKFDHDPFERIKNIYNKAKGNAAMWDTQVMLTLCWEAIEATVKELEGK